MLQKKNYTTSTTRFASVIKVQDKERLNSFFYIKSKKNLLPSKKRFYSCKRFSASKTFSLNTAGCVQAFIYNKKPYQLLVSIKTLFNNNLLLPGVESLLPGKRIFDLTKKLQISKVSYLGSQIMLNDLPHNLLVCSIGNNSNNKWTYAKSSGTSGIKLKSKKTVKLILVKLPSGISYFFFKNIKCFIGKNYNFFNNKFVEGKWGYSIHTTKKIEVRGVAMNPVDHPNGGRTKAKQPEKSPWGWIAKRTK